MEFDTRKLIFILLGPSGCGKTSAAKAAVATRRNKQVIVLSTGDKLREKKVLIPGQESDMKTVKAFCHEMMRETLEAFKVSSTHRLLILDCVKDLGDAHYITSEAKKHGLEITRALLMNDIEPKELEERWKMQGEPRDAIRGSASTYLNSWAKKFAYVIAYYKKLKILSKLSTTSDFAFICSSLTDTCSRDVNEFFPIIPCPKNLRFLLTDSIKARNIYSLLLSILEVTRFDFALPSSFIHSDRDVMWVANPARYHVTPKADGVRFLLFKVNNELFLINRKKEIFPCHITSIKFPNNTVLDGELLPSTSFSDIPPKISISLETSLFLVFDILALSGLAVWKWTFTERRDTLIHLAISKGIEAAMEQASCNNMSAADQTLQKATGGENETETLAVNVVIKEHHQSTTDSILFCLGLSRNIIYPCDGLVFTPNIPYNFGPDPLLFKWQPEGSIHCDIAHNDLQSDKRRCNKFLTSSLSFIAETTVRASTLCNVIMECQWDKENRAWDPLFERPDKVAPNSDEIIDQIERICQQPYTESHLIKSLCQICDIEELQNNNKEKPNTNSKHSALVHPVATYSFDQLYSQINELVQLNKVKRTVDLSTNLEIFNYCSSPSSSDPVDRLCRGLVLHPKSKTVVTRPFVRFFEEVSDPDPLEVVEATVKFDGSLGIAFWWKNEFHVTTRRRMDSEQAIWARQWIQDHCNLSSFQTGYTYLFEIVYKVNTVIVKYSFQGLVLLAVTDKTGYELSYDEVYRIGRVAGFFMVTPRITGLYSEITWYCGGIPSTNQPVQQTKPSSCSGALPATSRGQEGWVVKFSDGRRQKLVYSWWKKVSKLTRFVHPQIIWLLVKYDMIENMFRNAPKHIIKEVQRIVNAIERRFSQTLRRCQGMFKQSNIPSANANEDEDIDIQILIHQLNHYRNLFHSFQPLYFVDPSTESTNFSPFYKANKSNVLRLPVLEYIRPTEPTIEGYEPSDNFKQTWTKGWKSLPVDQREFFQEVFQENNLYSPILQLPCEVILSVCDFLDGRSLVMLSKVCWKFHEIVLSSKTLKKRMTSAKLIERRRLSYNYSNTLASRGFSTVDYGWDDWESYSGYVGYHDSEGYWQVYET